MSHQTGIQASEDLKDVFRRCTTSDDIRLVKVEIKDEQLVCVDTVPLRSDSWRDDYDPAVKPLLEKDRACYMFFRFDARDKWLFIAYTPDSATVRQKMLYSGTRSTVRTEFGGGFVDKDLIGTAIDEVTLSGYDENVRAAQAPLPFTDAEVEVMAIKQAENNPDISVDTRHKTHSGLSFPLDGDLQEAVGRFKEGSLNYLQMRINLAGEFIFLSDSGNYTAGELERVAPVNDAYYHMYRYDHVYDGEETSSIVFVYTMPGSGAPIKARMLYSSCKGTLIDELTGAYKIAFAKTLEVQEQAISEEFLMSEIHPPVVELKEKFSKPKAPGRRGPSKRPPRTNN